MVKRSAQVIAFIEKYCVTPEGEHVGELLKLAPFQKKFLRAIYDNPKVTSKAYLSIARKNGKTALIAAMLLAHLVGPEARQNSQIISGARSRDQAALVFNLALKMVQLSPALRQIVKPVPSAKHLIGLPMNVEYRAIAAEGTTAHGLSPVLAILDEVGQVKGPHDAFVDAIVTSQGAHSDPLLVAISTQAAEDGDLFSIWLDDASRSNDPCIVSHVYEADAGCELTDQKEWRKANPALGKFRSLKDMTQLAKEAERMPSAENTFRNLNLNQRVATVAPFVSKDTWQRSGAEPAEMFGPVTGGIDLSSRTDLTAMVLSAERDGKKHIWPFFWTPENGIRERSKKDRVPYDVWAREGYLRTTPGSTVDYEYVAKDIAEILSTVEVTVIAYDRWRMDLLKKEFEAIGFSVPLAPFGQGYKDMSPALDALEADLLNSRLLHGKHPVLTMCAANAIVNKDAAGNRKLDKQKATGRIDGMVALAMAVGANVEEQSPTPELIIL